MPNLPKTVPPGRLIGYARVSTKEQGTDPQLVELRAAGCATVLEERASSADRSRPVLAGQLHENPALVGVRLDRLARSVSHLLVDIEQLEADGAYFRSLRNPIDTTTPQGMFSLQVLGAVARREWALIAERTKAGLRAARSRGRVGGNTGLCAGAQDVEPNSSGWAGALTAQVDPRSGDKAHSLDRVATPAGPKGRSIHLDDDKTKVVS